MYQGNTYPTAWPQLATAKIYDTYAAYESWHIEEAASLVAGYAPRSRLELNFRPLECDPGTADDKNPEPPTPGALTWNGLLRGPVGAIIEKYARSRKIRNWSFDGDSLYVTPETFLQFCGRSGIHVPMYLADAVRDAVDRAKGKLPTEKVTTKASYKRAIIEVAEELAPRAASASKSLTIPELKSLVHHRLGESTPHVDDRSFQRYLRELKRDPSYRQSLEAVMRAKGRAGADESSNAHKWLSDKDIAVVSRGNKPSKKMRQARGK